MRHIIFFIVKILFMLSCGLIAFFITRHFTNEQFIQGEMMGIFIAWAFNAFDEGIEILKEFIE